MVGSPEFALCFLLGRMLPALELRRPNEKGKPSLEKVGNNLSLLGEGISLTFVRTALKSVFSLNLYSFPVRVACSRAASVPCNVGF